jgi:hypothetical protein
LFKVNQSIPLLRILGMNHTKSSHLPHYKNEGPQCAVSSMGHSKHLSLIAGMGENLPTVSQFAFKDNPSDIIVINIKSFISINSD